MVDIPHVFFTHTATVHFDFGESRFDLSKVRRRQLNIDGSQVLFQVIHVACTRDWNNPWLLRQKPCKGNLSRCRVLISREFSEPIDNRPVCFQVFRRKTLELGPKVRFRVELRASFDFPGQKTHSNRSPRDEADSQILASFKYAVFFRISFHERVFGLNCRNRLNGMRPADCSCTRLGETEVQDFPLLDEILDRTRHIFYWHFAIYPVLVIEINAVGLKALK